MLSSHEHGGKDEMLLNSYSVLRARQVIVSFKVATRHVGLRKKYGSSSIYVATR